MQSFSRIRAWSDAQSLQHPWRAAAVAGICVFALFVVGHSFSEILGIPAVIVDAVVASLVFVTYGLLGRAGPVRRAIEHRVARRQTSSAR